ncbi:unnamed protein product [Parajaminaea phylloscopi]
MVHLAASLAAIAAAAPLLASSFPFNNTLLEARTNGPVSESLRSCLSSAGIQAAYPTGTYYSTLDKQQNSALPQRKPGVFVVPANEDQVATAVKCVAKEGGKQKISPRSGGHSYTGYVLGSADGWVVVDLQHLNAVNVDRNSKTAKVGAGGRLGPTAKTLADAGFALPHGTCPTVGVGGHGLGGGYGFTSFQWGYLLDHIVSMRLVKADGSVVTVSAKENPDLWYALRGAGSNNFGIVTEFTYALQTAPTKIVNWSKTFKTNADCVQAFLAMQDLTTKSGDQGWSSNIGGEFLAYGQNGGTEGSACSFSGQYLGSKDDYKKQMKKYNDAASARGVTAASVKANEFSSWADALTDIMGDLSTSTVSPEAYYAKSLVTPSGVTYDANSFGKVMQSIDNARDYGASFSWAFLGPNSKPNSVSPGSSAYVHRDSLYISQLYSYDFPNNNDGGKQDRVYAAFNNMVNAAKAVNPQANWGGYVNYIDNRLIADGVDWAKFYYGSAVARLKTIKQQADPKTIFDFPMGISHAA